MLETVDRLVEAGWSVEAAEEEAARRLGDRNRWRSEMLAERVSGLRRHGGMAGVDRLVQDLRYAVRGIRRHPAFAWTLVATLALGIGASTAIFSVIDAVLLRPLPYHEPDRLVDLSLEMSNGFSLTQIRAEQVQPWSERADFLDGVALHARSDVVRTDGDEPERLTAIVASHTLDEVLGVSTVLGRPFGPDDGTPGARTVVLTWPYWNRLGSDPGVVGTTIRLDGEPWTVVGVLARGVKFPIAGGGAVWLPLASDMTLAGKEFGQIGVVGRLADHVELPAAQSRANTLGEQLAEVHPVDLGWKINLVPVGRWRANADTKRGLWMVAGSVGLMFLITVFNAINLLLVRAQERLAEMSVRKALGASRRRVVRQALVESVVLALIAGGVATGVAWLCVGGIRAVAPSELTMGMVHDFGLEGRALVAVAVLATATSLAVGLLPALGLAAAGHGGAGAVRERGRDRRGSRLRGALVTAEVATSMVLLTGAGLFLRSFAEMNAAETGMDEERVVFAELQLPESRYPTPSDRGRYAAEMTSRLRQIPGVSAAVVGMGVPPDGGGVTFGSSLQAEGSDPVSGEHIIPFGYVSPGHLAALGTRLRSGRELQADDRETGGVIIDRDLAHLVFETDEVLGKRFRFDEDDEWLTVVGIVEELRYGGVDDRIGNGVLLYPFDPEAPRSFQSFVVRTTSEASALVPLVRQAFIDVDGELPIQTLVTGEEAMAESTTRPRFLVLLMTVLSAIALSLSALGLYGVLSYLVRRRHRELGIRIALGAPVAAVKRTVLFAGAQFGLLGIAIGLAVASQLDDLIASLLFGVLPGDLTTTLVVIATTLGVTLLACLVPAVRATRVDPVEILKSA